MEGAMADPVINDFSLNIATPNGTGSQTSNNLIFRSLFHMGLAAARSTPNMGAALTTSKRQMLLSMTTN